MKMKKCHLCQEKMIHLNGLELCSKCGFSVENLDKIAREMSKSFPSRSLIRPPLEVGQMCEREKSFAKMDKELNPYLADMLFLAENNEAILRSNPYAVMDMNTSFRLGLIRELLVYKYAWAIPCKEALEAITRFSPIIEIGAGSGFWAKLLNDMGAEVLAYDSVSDGEGKNYLKKWFEVKQVYEDSILEHPEHTLFLCWPPFDDEMATNALKQYKGKTLLYVGESHGATASESFFELLEENFLEEEVIEIPVWPGMHDMLFIFTRKN